MSDDGSGPTQYGGPQGLPPGSRCRHQAIHRIVQSGPGAGRDSMVHRRSIKSCLSSLGDVERPALPGSDPIKTGDIPHLLNMLGRGPLFNPLVSLVCAAIRQPQISGLQRARGTERRLSNGLHDVGPGPTTCRTDELAEGCQRSVSGQPEAPRTRGRTTRRHMYQATAMAIAARTAFLNSSNGSSTWPQRSPSKYPAPISTTFQTRLPMRV